MFWLSRRKNGRWVVHECGEDSSLPMLEGKRIFQTKFAIDDVTKPGDNQWMWYDAGMGQWTAFNFKFTTTWVKDDDEAEWLWTQLAESNPWYLIEL